MGLIDRFYNADYWNSEQEVYPGQAELLHENLRLVQAGLLAPLSLCHPDAETTSDQAEELGFDKAQLTRLMQSVVEPGDVSLGYITNRTLGDNPFGGASYERDLSTFKEELTEELDDLRETLSRKLRVIDTGCGRGHAFQAIRRFQSVDESQSLGITLPLFGKRGRKKNQPDPPESEARIAWANIIHCGGKRNFDVLFDVYGAFNYHPGRRVEIPTFKLWPILQAIGFVSPGGRLYCNTASDDAKRFLLEKEVWEERRLWTFDLLRHPELNEIKSWLSLN